MEALLASFPPTIIIPGTVPPSAVDLLTSALYGPPQVTKTNRGVLPMADLPGSGAGSYGAFTGFRDDTPYGVRSTAEISHGSSSGMLPPALYGDVSAYSGDGSMVSRTRDANGNYSDPLTAIERATVPLPRARPTPSVPLPTWGPSWGIGINSMMPWERSSPGAAPQGDPWANDRFGIPVVPMKGYVTGNRAASLAPQHQATPASRPIIYTAPVAAGNFAEGSPNQSFEKDHGMGSVTKSMASSSRWNTGY